MKIIAKNEKMGMSFEFGTEAVTRIQYIPASEAPVKRIIDLPNDKAIDPDEMILVIWSLNNKLEEIPHVYIRPNEWEILFDRAKF